MQGWNRSFIRGLIAGAPRWYDGVEDTKKDGLCVFKICSGLRIGKNAAGETRYDNVYLTVTARGKMGRSVFDHCESGAFVFVEGELREYRGRLKRVGFASDRLQLRARSVQFLDSVGVRGDDGVRVDVKPVVEEWVEFRL